ncbi:hypothetical protein Purlil1_12744 [Purpureocillium lilacinum]|uniref:Uncharacterized protein n=1 Tax=Purpureocillium lilacinum TaxID=33203 RepID=A0ABR0BG06_PURLI|nr:hypothetical protein Purlil1_12744 [Purpureocillium lilacinum]
MAIARLWGLDRVGRYKVQRPCGVQRAVQCSAASTAGGSEMRSAVGRYGYSGLAALSTGPGACGGRCSRCSVRFGLAWIVGDGNGLLPPRGGTWELLAVSGLACECVTLTNCSGPAGERSGDVAAVVASLARRARARRAGLQPIWRRRRVQQRRAHTMKVLWRCRRGRDDAKSMRQVVVVGGFGRGGCCEKVKKREFWEAGGRRRGTDEDGAGIWNSGGWGWLQLAGKTDNNISSSLCKGEMAKGKNGASPRPRERKGTHGTARQGKAGKGNDQAARGTRRDERGRPPDKRASQREPGGTDDLEGRHKAMGKKRGTTGGERQDQRRGGIRMGAQEGS